MATKRPSRRAQVAAGLLVIGVGLGIAAVAASHIGKPPAKLAFDAVAVLIAGLGLLFTGAILVLPERHAASRTLMGALMITSIALLFDWLAFGPGEHRFTGAIPNPNMNVRSHFWGVPGRVLLDSGALLFDLMALWAWVRTLWRRPARS